MKAILEFNLPEEKEEFETAVKAAKIKHALYEVSQEIFRPARKHGYADVRMAGKLTPEVVEVIGILESMFYEILTETDVDIT